MRYLARIGAALTTGTALMTLATATALAGNFGEVTIIDKGEGPPTAGETREIRFVLLQHGVAPIEDGRVDVTLTNPESGDAITVQAVHEGDGIYVASVTFPVAGDWGFAVSHEWFETSPPTTLAVTAAEASAWLPAALAILAFAGAASIVIAGMVLFGLRPTGLGTAHGGPVRAEG